ncbi:MAG: NAD-dependent epimerase/dehydratase family protein [Chloroflexi bacterium]|nr:NAD-dependent epimerase/dehydratase family protein [Chloroflexota bacterium]
MRVLVIGGTRFFGKRIAHQLLQAGHEVSIFTRGNNRPAFWSEVEPILGDREDRNGFRGKLSSLHFDVVIDNIAYTAEDVQSAISTFAQNIGHYLLCSSGAVYHQHRDWRNWHPFYEPEADLDHKGTSAYAWGKRQAEKALWSIPEAERPFPFTVLRPTVVQGPDDPSERSWFWIQRVADGQEMLVPQTYPSTILRHAFADDVAQAFINATANPVAFYHAYNLAGEEIHTLEEYIWSIAEILGKEPRLVTAPHEQIQKLPGLADYNPPFAGDRLILDIAQAKRDLGYQPTPFPQWLEQTVTWFTNSYSGPDSEGYDRRAQEVAAARHLRTLSS